MIDIAVRLEAGATASAPALLLRSWRPEDAAGVADAHRDPEMRRWLAVTLRDRTEAERWIQVQREGWTTGERHAFAVLEAAPGDEEGRLAGHVVLKAPHGPVAEVGYWTAAHARGRGVAPRALNTLTDWARTALPGLTRLQLLHQSPNMASCRVAEKCGFRLDAERPPAPPEFPRAGHVHVRTMSAAPAS